MSFVSPTWRSAAARSSRQAVVLFILYGLAPGIDAQTTDGRAAIPPAARAVYRSQWFDLLNALQESDTAAARRAVAEMKTSGRAAGVERLSDYSRMALHEARRAERLGRLMAASLGFEAAVALDESSFDASLSRAGFVLRRGSLRDALPVAASALRAAFAGAESRLSVFSSLAVVSALAAAAAALAIALGLFVTHSRRISHDLKETASRPFGPRAGGPITLVLVALPIFLALGPVWLLLYWGALAYAYEDRRGRGVLAFALLGLGLAPLAVDAVARENLVRRSPLHLAAVNLAERREDATVEDGLASAAASFPEEPDVWYLLGLYAERAGDNARALAAYTRAMEADPNDYRPLVNRGNVRFSEGEFAQAIEDYEKAARLAPRSVESFYNLAVARSEIYDFKGQELARARAREISRRDFDFWSLNPPAARVIPATYEISRARERLRARIERADPLRPGGPLPPLSKLLLSPWCLAPWGALVLAFVIAPLRWRRGRAVQCARCGRAFCQLCKRYGGPTNYCGRCVRLSSRREEIAAEVRDEDLKDNARRSARRRWLVRLTSLVAPGTHAFLDGRPIAAAATLFAFFFAAAVAVGGPWIFGLRPLAPADATMPARLAVAVLALVIWLLALAGAWRQTREP